MVAQESEKITCQEEERSRKFYQLKTYFSSDDTRAISMCELKTDNGTHLANIRYIPSCRLTYILESKNDDNANGFAFDTKTGDWISAERMAIHMQNSNSILKSQIVSSTSSYLQRQLQMLFIFSLLTRLLYQIKEQFVHFCMHLSKL